MRIFNLGFLENVEWKNMEQTSTSGYYCYYNKAHENISWYGYEMGLNRAISQRAKSVKFKDEGKKGRRKHILIHLFVGKTNWKKIAQRRDVKTFENIFCLHIFSCCIFSYSHFFHSASCIKEKARDRTRKKNHFSRGKFFFLSLWERIFLLETKGY